MKAADMPPESWSQPEIVRDVLEIKETLADIRAELRAQRSEFVPRELWEDQKARIAVDIVDLEAEQARIRKDVTSAVQAERDDRIAGQRWAVKVAVSTAAALTAALAFIVDATGLGA